MSADNPTKLRIGASGVLNGRRYTVRGRVALSMVADDGERYYWQEFDVMDESHTTATLVFEETEDGPTWKWFTLIEPRRPLTAAEAAAKKVGDTIEFEGRRIPVVLVDESRVEQIEGQPPEGVERGDVARYFNADAGNGRLFVASWTGDEIEFYVGRDLGRRQVEQAFGLPAMASVAYSSGGGSGLSGSPVEMLKLGGVVLVIAIVVFNQIGLHYQRAGRAPDAPALRAASPRVLALASAGTLGQQPHVVAARAVTEVGLPGARFRAREYWLQPTDSAQPAKLLIDGWHDAGIKWLVFEPRRADFTPEAAASVRKGAKLKLGEQTFEVVQLCWIKPTPAEGQAPDAPWTNEDQYGFVARNGDDWLMCRWTSQTLRAFQGRAVLPAEILAGLKFAD